MRSDTAAKGRTRTLVASALVIVAALVVAGIVWLVGAVAGAVASDEGPAASAPSSDEGAMPAASSGSGGGGAAPSPVSPDVAKAVADAGFEAECIDRYGNPTLHAISVLSGAELAELLDIVGFAWEDHLDAWTSADGALLGATDDSAAVSRDRFESLPEGALGEPVAFTLTVTSYDSPERAFRGLATVNVIDRLEDGDALFAVVGSQDCPYLVVVAETGASEQTFLVFTGQAVAQGMFSDAIGIDAGDSVAESWRSITGGRGLEASG